MSLADVAFAMGLAFGPVLYVNVLIRRQRRSGFYAQVEQERRRRAAATRALHGTDRPRSA